MWNWIFKSLSISFYLFVSVSVSFSYELNLKEPMVESENGTLNLLVELESIPQSAFSPILRGGEVYFQMDVKMYRVVDFPLVPDETVMSGRIVRKVSYDIIHDEFKVKEEIKKDGFIVAVSFRQFPSFKELKDFLSQWRFNAKKISELENGEEYYFEVRLSVYSYKLYPPISIIVNLLGGGEEKSDWVESGKVVVP